MKPFLSVDLTYDKENEEYNGQEFVVQRPNSALSQALEKTSDEAIDMLLNKTKLPLIVRIIYWTFGVIGFTALMGLIKILMQGETSIAETYALAPWIFFCIAGCLIIWLIGFVAAHKKEKLVLESDENKNLDANLEDISNNILAELSVPKDSPEIDILSFTYKTKNGENKPCAKGLKDSPFDSYAYRVFCDEQKLYLANFEEKYAFNISCFKAIRTVKKKFSIPVWNKDVEPNDALYKQYKIKIGEYGEVLLNAYHILEFEHNGELWGIYFPNYELPTVENLTGLKAE